MYVAIFYIKKRAKSIDIVGWSLTVFYNDKVPCSFDDDWSPFWDNFEGIFFQKNGWNWTEVILG